MITEKELYQLKRGDKVLVECTVEAVFVKSGMVMVTTRDCDKGFDAYEDEVTAVMPNKVTNGNMMHCKTIEDCFACSEYHDCSNNKAKYITKLQKRIEELEKKVKFLEKEKAIKALDEDTVSREAVLNYIRDNYRRWFINDDAFMQCVNGIKDFISVTPKQRLCKDCKFFECNVVTAEVGWIPLIVAHEICNKWGDGCKTSEDGYCFLFEPKMEGESE